MALIKSNIEKDIIVKIKEKTLKKKAQRRKDNERNSC